MGLALHIATFFRKSAPIEALTVKVVHVGTVGRVRKGREGPMGGER